MPELLQRPTSKLELCRAASCRCERRPWQGPCDYLAEGMIPLRRRIGGVRVVAADKSFEEVRLRRGCRDRDIDVTAGRWGVQQSLPVSDAVSSQRCGCRRDPRQGGRLWLMRLHVADGLEECGKGGSSSQGVRKVRQELSQPVKGDGVTGVWVEQLGATKEASRGEGAADAGDIGGGVSFQEGPVELAFP